MTDAPGLLVARLLLDPEVAPPDARELGGGLVAVAAVLHDGRLTDAPGCSVDDALAGLRTLPTPEHQLAAHAVHAFEAADPLGASRLLVVEDLLAAVGEPDLPDDGRFGLLVAVPDARVLLVHAVRDEQVLRAAHLMATIARMRQGEADAIGPHVYHRTADGTLTQVTQHSDDEIEVHVDGSLADALAGLGLVDRSRKARRAAARRARG
ncbi:hypothetical protein [Cellulomonas composti]|uniref:Uncharacterized protein n=1 Tax=Cellulomonas composti TaxID=266130 RepID=A0A511J8Y0_9CELL|nr:hypothetical protein [Cellulomonas composti]GEL94458.1 hypothetical protein CCO02nite_11160 [Cellulomonas composti]